MPRMFGFYTMTRRTRIALVVLLTLVLLVTCVLYVEANLKKKPIQDVYTEKRIVALTFDISWGSKTPPAVIEVLKNRNVSCTFFISGPWAKEYPDIVKSIVQNGHEIASHGNRHINLSILSKSEVKEEIQKAHQDIKWASGVDAVLIRTPNRDFNNNVLQAIEECHYEAIQWGTDSLDWMNPGADNIVERINKRVHPGDIILMHASDTCQQTAAALPQVISSLQSQGYQLVTVSTLLQERAPTGQN